MTLSCFPKKNKKNKSKSINSDYRNLTANKIQNLESEIRDLNLKNNKLDITKNQLRNKNKNLKCKNIELNQQNNDLQNEIEKLNNKINDLESENKSLHELILENKKNNYRSKVMKYKSKYKKLKCKYAELDQENNDLQNTRNELEKQLNNLKSENNNYKLEIEKIKSDNEKLKNTINELKNQTKNLDLKNKYLKDENIESNLLNNNLQDKFRELEKQFINLESENNEYQIEIKKNQLENKNLELRNNKICKKNKKLQNENENLEKQINSLESEYKILIEMKIENENNNHETEIKEYQSEIENLKGENIKLNHSNKNLQNTTKELKNQVKNLESENEKYQSKNEKMESKSNKFEELYKNLQNKIERLESYTNNLESEKKSLKARNENLERFPNQSTNIPIAKGIEIWKPLGFANPKGYCYLNSVVQILGSCCEFKTDIYNYKWISTDKTNDSIFVEGLFNLIKAIHEYDRQNLEDSLSIVQQNNTESSFGDDVYKCFMNLLTRVSNVIKTNADRPSDHFTNIPITLSEKAKNNFTRFKNRNPGFVFDNFYGQVTFQMVCKLCNHLCNESFQMIKSLPLPVPNSNSSETLNSCVDLFFNDSDVEVDEPMKCECKNGSTVSLKSISKLTHGPKYLFIYLNRGSYTDDGVKNDTHVTCDDLTIHIKTLENQSIKYKLISVIDHVGDSSYGHYYCKCSFETEDWWLLNDSQVSLWKNKKEIVTKNTIVFLFKIFSRNLKFSYNLY